MKAFPTGEIEWTAEGKPVQLVDYEIWADGSDDLWSGKHLAWVKRDLKGFGCRWLDRTSAKTPSTLCG